jgi:LDH2 family malate/lactate/ureidoglycolate dehydrogenase
VTGSTAKPDDRDAMLRVRADELTAFVREVAERCGLPDSHIPLFTDAVMQADLRGLPSHGVFRLDTYARGFQRGLINPRPKLRETGDRPGSRLIDADNGLGLIVGQLAMDRAVALARENGVGAVSVRNSNHSGVLAVHVQRAAAAGMIGFFTSNAPALMAPWGGRDALISNSPFAYSFPTGSDPVIVDMACSATARGKIRLAASDGRAIPTGWALDSDGNATEDARAAMDGIILPMAEHKGSALALAFEILSASLSGATPSKDASRAFLRDGADTLDSWQIGHFALAIDVGGLRPLADFESDVVELVDAVHSTTPRAGFDRVQMPGERELESVSHLAAIGIPLSSRTLAALATLAAELGFEPQLTALQEDPAPG